MLEKLFFAQLRVGKDEKPFRLWKFRTFRSATELFPLGVMLRRWRIDELPQFYNILRGEMTFFGPRPLPPEEHRLLPDDVRVARSAYRPGWLAPSHVLLGDFTRDDFVRAERDYFSDTKQRGRARASLRCISVIMTNVIVHGARGRTPKHLVD